jgi:ABC-2 type transport system ATP-binding protein
MNSSLIVTKNLVRRFDDLLAVNRLSIEVQQGEIFGFLGHNGAGKTTTVRLLNGLLAAQDGQARVFGLSPDEDGAAIRARTGVLTETPALEERLSARENLTIFADLYGVNPDRVSNRVQDLLEQFSLGSRGDDPVREFSKGMKQRLALARTLLHDPELIFLDEPTSGLDPVSAREVQNLIRSLSGRGKTIFLCTHNLEEAQRLCHRVAVLQHGRLIAQGTPQELSRRTSDRAQLEIEVSKDRVQESIQLLSRQGSAADGTERSGWIKLTGLDRDQVPGLVKVLSEAGIPIYQIRSVERTLEDVYFSLHGKKE